MSITVEFQPLALKLGEDLDMISRAKKVGTYLHAKFGGIPPPCLSTSREK